LRYLLRESPEYSHFKLIATYLNRNKEILKKARVPWFLPELVGGLGLPGVPSADDIRYFNWCLKTLKTLPCSERPRALSNPAEWKLRSLVESQLRTWKCPQSVHTSDEQASTREAFGWLTGMLLLDPKIQTSPDLVHEKLDSQTSINKALRFNEKFISSSRVHSKHFPNFITIAKHRTMDSKILVRAKKQSDILASSSLPLSSLENDINHSPHPSSFTPLPDSIRLPTWTSSKVSSFVNDDTPQMELLQLILDENPLPDIDFNVRLWRKDDFYRSVTRSYHFDPKFSF